ncbi:hypothetical protein KSP39_PZI015934 [Platanthera zijinensis]|uniref:Uncharacterized protein n=1 Tax=Platanthera zijinensis TaxID=2320716 RepID=A0AAP0BAW7_9ASPA
MGSITDNENFLAAKTETSSLEGDNICGNPPSIVFFPNVAQKRIDSPLKLEVADSAEDMSPRNMWQGIVEPSIEEQPRRSARLEKGQSSSGVQTVGTVSP